MNRVVLAGRLTTDPDIRHTGGAEDLAVARYRLAVDRRVARNNGEQTADFINCVAFGKRAEFAEKYLRKGIKIMVSGRIQTGSYTNNEGQKVYTTDVIVEEHEFCESKGSSNSEPGGGFVPAPDDADFEGLPFA
jgi:single-strand DNA-binding protein